MTTPTSPHVSSIAGVTDYDHYRLRECIERLQHNRFRYGDAVADALDMVCAVAAAHAREVGDMAAGMVAAHENYQRQLERIARLEHELATARAGIAAPIGCAHLAAEAVAKAEGAQLTVLNRNGFPMDRDMCRVAVSMLTGVTDRAPLEAAEERLVMDRAIKRIGDAIVIGENWDRNHAAKSVSYANSEVDCAIAQAGKALNAARSAAGVSPSDDEGHFRSLKKQPKRQIIGGMPVGGGYSCEM